MARLANEFIPGVVCGLCDRDGGLERETPHQRNSFTVGYKQVEIYVLM